MSRFTETHVAHVLETTSETWWGDWRCICGQEGRVAHALDLSRTLKDLQIRRAHAAHVESMLVEAGVVAVELPEASAANRWDAGVDAVFRDGDGISAVVSSATEAQLVYPSDPVALAAVLLAAAAVRPVTPELTTGQPSVVTQAFAQPLRTILDGDRPES